MIYTDSHLYNGAPLPRNSKRGHHSLVSGIYGKLFRPGSDQWRPAAVYGNVSIPLPSALGASRSICSLDASLRILPPDIGDWILQGFWRRCAISIIVFTSGHELHQQMIPIMMRHTAFAAAATVWHSIDTHQADSGTL